MSLLLRVLALVAFTLACVGFHTDFSLLALGLALWVASTLVGEWPVTRP